MESQDGKQSREGPTRVIIVSEHAIDRFRERVRDQRVIPCRRDIIRQIVRVAYQGRIIESCVIGQEYRVGDFYGIEFVVHVKPMRDNEGWVVTTVLGPDEPIIPGLAPE